MDERREVKRHEDRADCDGRALAALRKDALGGAGGIGPH